jgi:hypothetical protein
MKFTIPKLRFTSARFAIAGAFAVAAVAFAVTAARMSAPFTPADHLSTLAFKKGGDPDALLPGANKRALIGPNEYRNAGYTPEVEAYLLRALPGSAISPDLSFNAAHSFATFSSNPHSAGVWSLRGASMHSREPGILNVLGNGADVFFSGRITALTISSNCTKNDCRLYLAAAGGGVWRTLKALDSHPQWDYLSIGFGINAIGSLIMDPNDTTGNTLYAGTGEPNASADSEAGVGVYKTTDGGNTWSFVPGTDIFFQRAIGDMAIDNSGNLLVPIASGVRGVDETYAGAQSSGNVAHPLPTRGLYRCNGVTCTRIFTAPAPTRGSTRVRIDPTHAGFIYVNAFGGAALPNVGGIWRSTDNGVTFTQIFAPRDNSANTFNSALERDEFDVTTLSSGATRMYVGAGEGGEAFNPPSPQATFWRSDNADTMATFVSLGGAQVIDFCGGQCWYDDVVYTPRGNPDVVYLGGSFDYSHIVANGHGSTNGRALLLSTDAGATWSDMTQDGRPTNANAIHPDQHAIVTSPTNPFQFFEGCDGGLFRSDGSGFTDVSSKCNSRGLNAADTAFCKSLLSRVPNNLTDINTGLSTLQFNSLSVSPKNPKNNIQGGTQDNGTWGINGSTVDINMEIYGDGGQSGFNASQDTMVFNTFSGQASDVNFHGGDPAKWCVATGPIVSSPEGSLFYPPITADPNPTWAGTIFQGSFSVWRTQDWGGNQKHLENDCPEFSTSSANPACGDFVPIGNGVPSTRLTSSAWGSRAGGAVVVISRRAADGGTLWAATTGGRVFFSANGNDPAASVVWERLDQSAANTPNRVPTGIFIDPANPNHVWISYSGYNANTPGTPGHVFDVMRTGPSTGTWTDISNNLPDFPITDVAQDSVTGDLYAASDFGVMKLPSGGSVWAVAGTGLPAVEVSHLTIVPSARLLYAATHGRSAWMMNLP